VVSQEPSETCVHLHSHSVVNLGAFNTQIIPNALYVILYSKTDYIKQIQRHDANLSKLPNELNNLLSDDILQLSQYVTPDLPQPSKNGNDLNETKMIQRPCLVCVKPTPKLI
jgi:hypothetical protein